MEEILFANFMSDYDPSFLILVTYNPTRQCSYVKTLKIFNKVEQEEDWHSANANYDCLEEKTYSMVEDDAKERLIQNIRNNLQNEPSVTKK